METNRSYVPAIAGPGPVRTLYKDCMEKRGYTKIRNVNKEFQATEPGTVVTGIWVR